MNRRFSLTTTMVVGVLIWSGALGEVLIRTSISDPSYHPRGIDVFSIRSTETWGGVVLQGTATYLAADGSPVPFKDIEIGAYDPENEALCIRVDSKCHFLSVSLNTLARIVSFIDNRHTGLFTVYELDQDTADRAGLVALASMTLLDGRTLDGGAHIAKEFHGNPALESAIAYMDFPAPSYLETAPNEAVLKRKWNVGLREGLGRDYDYIVSDLDSDFRVKLVGDHAELSGTLYVYDRTIVNENARATVTAIQRFIEMPPCCEQAALFHRRALLLAQQVAALRAINDNNSKAWKDLLAQFEEPHPPTPKGELPAVDRNSKSNERH